MITFILNHKKMHISDEGSRTLLYWLRNTVCMKGTKEGCSTGHCGACTVLINNAPRRSCVIPLKQVDGCEILTIEGLTEEGKNYPGGIHPIQQAFLDAGAVQCGFCTPGMILSAKALLDRNHSPNPEDICRGLSHNYCRCTGYVKIIEAVRMAAWYLYPEENPPWRSIYEHTSIVKGKYGAPMENISGKFVGQSRTDVDGVKKVSGRLKFADDLNMKDCCFGVPVYAGIPKGELLGIDWSNAKDIPGFIAVLTARDVPGINGYGAIQMDQPVFCEKEINYCYDTVALAVADSPEHARMAAECVKLNIREKTGVYTMEDAVKNNMIFARMSHETGNIDEAKRENGLCIVRQKFDMPFVEHACMEPESATAVWKEGKIHLYACTQSPFEVREIIAANLQLEKEAVQVTATPLGGGFGSKCDPTIESATAVAAYVLKRTVKVTLSRRESMGMTNKRHAYHTEYEAGFRMNGEICYLEAKLTADGGPYKGLSPGVLEQSLIFAGGPYRIPSGRAEGIVCRTNNAPGGAFRGFGINQAAFSIESVIDEAAQKLGMDIFEIRLRNALQPGDVTFSGQTLNESVGMEDAIMQCRHQAKKRLEEYRRQFPEKVFAMGGACGYKNVGVGKGAPDDGGAEIIRYPDGHYLLVVTGIDMGQGFRTAMCQLACEVLECDWKDIVMENGDTGKTYAHTAAVSERQTLNSGRAVVEACRILKNKHWEPGLKVYAQYQYRAPETYALDDQKARKEKGKQYRNYPSYAYTAQAVIVEKISEEKVKIRHVIAAHDVGRAINPMIIEGQIEGSCSMGIGYALSESYELEQGYPKTKMYGQLGLLRAEDTPAYDIILIEDPEEEGPFGAKGISEVATVPVTPAVTAGAGQLFGKRITKIPFQKGK